MVTGRLVSIWRLYPDPADHPDGSAAIVLLPALDRSVPRHQFIKTLAVTIPILAAVTISFVSGPLAIINEDTNTYLSFNPLRTAGYPLFTKGLLWIYDDLVFIAVVQHCLFVACSIWLLVEVIKISGSYLLAVVISLALAANMDLLRFHSVIATESLYVSLSLGFIAVTLSFLRDSRFSKLAALSVITGLAITVRPIGYALVPLLFLLIILNFRCFRGRLVGSILLIFLPMLLILAAEHFVYTSRHGNVRESLLGLHLFAKAGLVEVEPEEQAVLLRNNNGVARDLLARLDQELAPLRRFLRSIDDFYIRKHVLTGYEGILQYRYATDLRSEAAGIPGAGARYASKMLQSIGLQRLSFSFQDFLDLSWLHFRGLWTVYSVRTPETLRRYEEFIAESRPLPLESEVERKGVLLRHEKPVRLASAIQKLIQFSGIVTGIAALLACVFYLWRRPVSHLLFLAAFCGFMVHGNFLLVALTGLGISRYTLAMWPPIVISVSCCGYMLVQALIRFGSIKTGVPKPSRINGRPDDI